MLNISSLKSRLFGGMDQENKTEIEAVRLQKPRYLFRAWQGSSGGDIRLNTPERITPKAFLLGRGHASPYDMTFEEFKSMAWAHLRTDMGAFVTEFSSWSQSISFVLGLYTGTVEYISVIDTQELQETNSAYYVPLLPIHRLGSFTFDHEYLVHGVVQGKFHRAVPIVAFRKLGLTSDSFTWFLGKHTITDDYPT